jgi:hypothetical protein
VTETFACPSCGADVPSNAAACPECGSDDETGWSRDAGWAHTVEDHEPSHPPRKSALRHWLPSIAIAALVLFLATRGLIWSLWLLPVIAVVLFFARRSSDAAIFEVDPESASLERLLQRCAHDRERAERLIEAERRHAPSTARRELIQRAILRLERDRR